MYWTACTPSHTIQNIVPQPGCGDAHDLGCRCTHPIDRTMDRRENDALGCVDEVRVYCDCSFTGNHRVETSGIWNELRANWWVRRNRVQPLLRVHGRRRLSERQDRQSLIARRRLQPTASSSMLLLKK